jgi:3-phytase
MVFDPNSNRVTVVGATSLGQVIFPPEVTFGSTPVGGLSGITYDSATNSYYSISDDRSQNAPARFYQLNIDLTDGVLNPGDVAFTNVTTLLDGNGNPFPQGSVDLEGIALTNTGTLFISSEGDATAGINPSVNQFSLTGGLINGLTIPDKFLLGTNKGVRNNLAFESATITPNGRYLYTATENAIVQDGPAADLNQESRSRIVQYDLTTGQVVAEYVYETEAVEAEPIPPTGFRTNGLVELIALDNSGTLLSLERSFSDGVGNSIKLFEVFTQGNTDMKGFEGIDGFDVDATAYKRLLFDFADLGIPLDNIEGMALGPKLPDGRQSLTLVSDNNFSATQSTQFITLALDLGVIPAVEATLETPPEVRFGGDPNNTDPTRETDPDDPAFYIHPTDPSQSFILFTLKNAGLVVYDLQGQEIQRIAPDNIRYNNVDIIYGFELGGQKVDLAIASDRANDTLGIFKIDPTTRQLTDITAPTTKSLSVFGGVPREDTVYGLAAYKSPVSDKSYVFVSQAQSNQIAQLELKDNGTTVNAEVVRILTVPIPPGGALEDAQVEGMVVDQELGRLFVAQEDVGVFQFSGEPDGPTTPLRQVEAVDTLKPDGNIITNDVEGLTIYYGDNGTGYLFVSSQGNGTYPVYEREGNNDYLGSIVVGTPETNGIDRVEESDGADVTGVPLGPQFPFGVLALQDGSNDPQVVFNALGDMEYQNYSGGLKLVPLENVANAFPTPLELAPGVYDPRDPVKPELVFGTPASDNLDAGASSQDRLDGIQDLVFSGAQTDVVDLTTSSFPTVGKNRVDAGSGDDLVFATRNDRVFGNSGNDILDTSLGKGSNRVYGGVGNDEIYTSSGDNAFGGEGNDIIDASLGGGGNRLYGGNGDDIFFLGSNDRVVGGEGADQIYVGAGGGNTITGGEGADQFWVVDAQLPSAANTITDLQIGTDVIGIGGFLATDVTFGQVGNDAVLLVAGQNVATFLGITQAQLQTATIVFA